MDHGAENQKMAAAGSILRDGRQARGFARWQYPQ
jgi:hypothetical protein